MDACERIDQGLAMFNLDIAISYLRTTIDEKCGAGNEDYASKLNRATMAVNTGVWHHLPSKRRVKTEIIPMLQEAYKILSANRTTYPENIIETIESRIDSLRRYCQGLPQQIPSEKELTSLQS